MTHSAEQIEQLQARLKELEKLRELAILDSCDDDTRIRELAKPFLSREQIDGDSYGVPGIIDVVESLVKRLKESEAYAESLAHDICEMEDALGFKNDCTDKNGAFVPTLGVWLELVRDLIAAEAELGDYKQAMEREKKPEWSDNLKELAGHLEKASHEPEAYSMGRVSVLQQSSRELRERQVQLATLHSLLEETRSMHLRTEEHRDWLDRRDAALAMP